MQNNGNHEIMRSGVLELSLCYYYYKIIVSTKVVCIRSIPVQYFATNLQAKPPLEFSYVGISYPPLAHITTDPFLILLEPKGRTKFA